VSCGVNVHLADNGRVHGRPRPIRDRSSDYAGRCDSYGFSAADVVAFPMISSIDGSLSLLTVANDLFTSPYHRCSP
jgi:hypothetical protein